MASDSRLRILLVGASGLTGQAVLRILLESESVGEVHAPLRSPLFLQHPKLHFHPWQGQSPRFSHLPDLPFDAVLCCLGTTIKKAGSQAAFQEIDRDTVLELGVWARLKGVPRFLVISSTGANARSGNFYLRTKGEMEEGLRNLGLPSTTVLRPGLLLGDRQEFRPAERLGQIVAPLLNPLLRGPLLGLRATPVPSLARVMVELLFSPAKGYRILENREILETDQTKLKSSAPVSTA